MSLLALSKAFEHRRSHAPSPPHSSPSKHVSTTVSLTPPLTLRSTDTNASIPSLHISTPAIPFPSSDLSSPHPVEQSTLPSPISPTHSAGELDLSHPTHFLFVSGVPKDAPTHTLKQVLGTYGELKGIFVKFQEDNGTIILAFYDIRHTLRAHRAISSPTHPFFPGPTRLDSRFITPEELHSIIGHSPFIDATNSTLRITTSPVGQREELDVHAFRNILASFGDLNIFNAVSSRTYHVELFDARDATIVLDALNGRVILRQRLHIVPYSVSAPDPSFVPAEPGPPKHEGVDAQNKNTVSFPRASPLPRSRRFSVDSSLPSATLHPMRSLNHFPPHTRHMSNVYHFDSTGKPAILHTPPRPRSISSTASDDAGLAIVEESSSDSAPPPISSSSSSSSSSFNRPDSQLSTPFVDNTGEPVASYTLPRPCSISSMASDDTGLALVDVSASGFAPLPVFASYSVSSLSSGPNSQRSTPFVVDLSLTLAPEARGPMTRQPDDLQPEINRIDVARIESGDDTRTTVMIRNIPNKMSDKNLFDFIKDVCPRKIDFLYLRMDFANGHNSGYAFVNFIHVQDLLHFSKLKLGTKWNLFSSEKILGMSYAAYQGKEALVEKFRTSPVMYERKSWRPKIFYSEGPMQGLPEVFPAPKFVQRKVRGTGVRLH